MKEKQHYILSGEYDQTNEDTSGIGCCLLIAVIALLALIF